MRTINDVIQKLPSPNLSPLEAPPYISFDDLSNQERVALAVESMRRHTSDEGFQIMQGLEGVGYYLLGWNLTRTKARPEIGMRSILVTDLEIATYVPTLVQWYNASVVVVQDKREWDGRTVGPGFDTRERFQQIEYLKTREDIFKVTILKDAHANPEYHRQSAEEMGCHAWVVYYHPRIVQHLAPYVRPQHLVRTYHTLNRDLISIFSPEGRGGCLLSGAVSGAYPLRTRLVRNKHNLRNTTYLPHPGYHRNGCATPEFLKTLSQYKVAICTSSIYGYAIRKIIEGTACGCVVITDLPTDDPLPEIDGNLVRVRSETSVTEMNDVITRAIETYDPEKQEIYAQKAQARYDYRVECSRLANEIETMRNTYPKA